MSNKTVTLVGGTRGGKEYTMPSWQKILYVPKRISLSELKALEIDANMAWRGPDEVYVQDSPGVFRYVKTVDYKPGE